jgi:hypothetical protein
MKSSQISFDGSRPIFVHTAHGIETRYIAKEARGLLASTDSPCVSVEKPEGKPRRDERRTTEDRPPEVDSSSFSNASREA